MGRLLGLGDCSRRLSRRWGWPTAPARGGLRPTALGADPGAGSRVWVLATLRECRSLHKL